MFVDFVLYDACVGVVDVMCFYNVVFVNCVVIMCLLCVVGVVCTCRLCVRCYVFTL